MKKIIAVAVVAVAVLSVGIVGYSLLTAKPAAPEREITSHPATVDGLLKLINTEREKVGAGQLAMDSRLSESAQWMADDTSKRDYFAHKDPASGKKVGLDKATELTGLTCRYIGENIYKGGGLAPLSEHIVQGWLDSESHREAMLDDEYSLTGIGLAVTKDNDTVAVQHFCKVK